MTKCRKVSRPPRPASYNLLLLGFGEASSRLEAQRQAHLGTEHNVAVPLSRNFLSRSASIHINLPKVSQPSWHSAIIEPDRNGARVSYGKHLSLNNDNFDYRSTTPQGLLHTHGTSWFLPRFYLEYTIWVEKIKLKLFCTMLYISTVCRMLLKGWYTGLVKAMYLSLSFSLSTTLWYVSLKGISSLAWTGAWPRFKESVVKPLAGCGFYQSGMTTAIYL